MGRIIRIFVYFLIIKEITAFLPGVCECVVKALKVHSANIRTYLKILDFDLQQKANACFKTTVSDV